MSRASVLGLCFTCFVLHAVAVIAGQESGPGQSTNDDRPKIRVLSDPKGISSFYRRGGAPRYRFTPRPEQESFPYPTTPHPISSYYRSDDNLIEPLFDPPGYVPYAERAFTYRVYRPGFFLGGFPGSLCRCDCGRN